MNTSFRVSLLYLLLIIPQHGNSPLPVMESWLQKDQDDGIVQRDMTSSLTGGDESFGSAHQTYQNSLIRKKKADIPGNMPMMPGYRKFAPNFDRNQNYDQPSPFFNSHYMNKDYNPPVFDPERGGAVFDSFEGNPALPANKYRSRTPNLENINEENYNPRLMNKYGDDKNTAIFGSRMNTFRTENMNDDIGRNSKWSFCKRLKQRYASNPLMDFPSDNLNYNEHVPLLNDYTEDKRRRARNQDYKDTGRSEVKNPQVFDENEYYVAEGNALTGEEDSNVEGDDYNQILNEHSYMHKRDEADQQQYNQKAGASEAAQVVQNALKFKNSAKGFRGSSISKQVTRNSPELTWRLDSPCQSTALNDILRNSQRALHEIQSFQQKLSYKSPEGNENDDLKRESREPSAKSLNKNVKFDEKRLKREDEDEQKNMKTGTDEGGGGEYEDEEGKGHKDEEEYYEDADLSDDESANDVRKTDRLNQRFVKREIPEGAHLKSLNEDPSEVSQDYELSLENAPIENSEKARKSSFREDNPSY